MKPNFVFFVVMFALLHITTSKTHDRQSRYLTKNTSKRYIRDLRYAAPPKRIGNYKIGRHKLKNRQLVSGRVTEHDLINMEIKHLKDLKRTKKIQIERIPRYLKGDKNIKTIEKQSRDLSSLSPRDKARIEALKAKRDMINEEIANTLHNTQATALKASTDKMYDALGIHCDNDKKYALLGVGALTAGSFAGKYRRKKLKKKHKDMYSKMMMNVMVINQIEKEINGLKEVVEKMTAAGMRASRIENDLTFLIQRKIGNLITK